MIVVIIIIIIITTAVVIGMRVQGIDDEKGRFY
jgi:hypothetical protein